PAPDPATARYEIDFMSNMIDHHHMAIEMSEICLERAVHHELRHLCRDIKTSQSAEIEELQSWLDDWYGISHEPEMKPGEEAMLRELEARHGADFEIAFMESMIEHHRKAIHEADQCVDRAYHDELVDLCENMIETQSEEIALMESWLCEWYSRCSEHDAD
ncbi:MAG: DUF305 domain-containing protein, partial [Actinomycetota bacterium]|nr:DUF305 domain-containing protein [Actinomycetota bacterium]